MTAAEWLNERTNSLYREMTAGEERQEQPEAASRATDAKPKPATVRIAARGTDRQGEPTVMLSEPIEVGGIATTLLPEKDMDGILRSAGYTPTEDGAWVREETEQAADVTERTEEEVEQQAEEEIQPVGNDPQWGNVYQWATGKVKEAVDFLRKHRSGYLKGVFHRDEIGDIDLAWGNDKAGLQHIIQRHIAEQDDFNSVDEAVEAIKRTVQNGKISQYGDRYIIDDTQYRVIVAKDTNGNWVITAYDNSREKESKQRNHSSATPLVLPSTGRASSSDVGLSHQESGGMVPESEGKGSENNPNTQEVGQKNVPFAANLAAAPRDEQGRVDYTKIENADELARVVTAEMEGDKEMARKWMENRKKAAKERSKRQKHKADETPQAFMEMEERMASLQQEVSRWDNALTALRTIRTEEEQAAYDAEQARQQADAQNAHTTYQEQLDSQGNPIDKNGDLIVEEVESVYDITDEDFDSPSRNVALPAIPNNIASALGIKERPVIIKKNIFEKNRDTHEELSPEDSRAILINALYNTNLYGQSKPVSRPSYRVAIQIGDDKNSVVVIDVYQNKDKVEIVGWRYINEKGLERLKKQVKREDGQLLILSPSSGLAAALSALPSNDVSSLNGKSAHIKKATLPPASDTAIQGDQLTTPVGDKEIYNRHTTAKQSTETAEASRAGEQSGTQQTPSMNAPISGIPAGKGTKKSATDQIKSQKNAENLQNASENGEKTGGERHTAADLRHERERIIRQETGKDDASAYEESVELVDFNEESDLYMEAETILNELMGGKGDVMSVEYEKWYKAHSDKGYGIPSLRSIIDEIERQQETWETERINEQFNRELQQQIEGTLPKGHIYRLGMPSGILLACGFPDMPIELSSTNLAEHAKKTHHPFELGDARGIVEALQHPIAVFAYGDQTKSQNVIVEIQKDGRNFLVGVHFNQNRRGLEVSDIRGIFPKDNAEWLNWINQGKALYLDKEKIQGLISKQRKNLAEVTYLDLDSAAKVVKNFDNPKLLDEKSEKGGNKMGKDKYSPKELYLLRERFEEQQEQMHRIREQIRQLIGGVDSEHYQQADKEKRTEADRLKAEYDKIARSMSHNDLIALSLHLWDSMQHVQKQINETTDEVVLDRLYKELNYISEEHTVANKMLRDFYGDGNIYPIATSEDGGVRLRVGGTEQSAMTEDQQAAYDVVRGMLGDAGVPVEVLTDEAMTRLAETAGVRTDAHAESVEEADRRFNEEIEQYRRGEMKTNEYLSAGNPSGVLRMFMPNLPVIIRQHVLSKASVSKHNVDVSALKNLPSHISHPIFVFQRNDNTLGILTEIKDRDGKNVCVAIELGKTIQSGKDYLEVNDVRSIHGRDIENIILPIVHNNTLRYVDKEKGLVWLSSASSNYQQEIDKKDLDSAAKVVKKFENPKFSEEKNEKDAEKHGAQILKDRTGVVYGAAVGGKIYLNGSHLNPNTPMHEYTHLWDDMVRRENPALWERGKELLKQLPLWDEVRNDPNYANIRDNEDEVASEVHSRLSGEDGAKLLDEMVERAKREGTKSDVAKSVSLKNRIRDWLREMWTNIKGTFEKWGNKDLSDLSVERFARMPLRDLADGISPKNGSKKQTVAKNAAQRYAAQYAEPFDMTQSGKVRQTVLAEVRREREEIERKAKADGTWMKAPNGNPTNLTQEQWITVRTKRFKNWFGDWNAKHEAYIEMPNRLAQWLSKENIEKAKGKSRDEILKEFGNKPQPIAFIPVKFLQYVDKNLTDNRVYSGMGYFIDHAVNHHPNIPAEKYQHIQDVLNNPDEVKAIVDNGNNSIVFIKQIDRYNAVVIEVEKTDDGRIIWHKSFYDQKKKPYAHKGTRLYESSSEGGVSPIIRTDESAHDSSLSVLDDGAKVQQKKETTKSFGNFLRPDADFSQIVDENGEPMVVYHGTRADFTIFDSNKNNPTLDGFYFTDREELAKKFAGYKGHVGSYFLNVRNPERNGFDGSGANMKKSEYRDGGIFIKRQTDRYAEKGTKEIIVFSPNQIKSATDNAGTFSTANDDIRFSIIGEKGASGIDKSEKVSTRIDNLRVARQMEHEGKDERAIRMATGWERGTDNKWRYEIEDLYIKPNISMEDSHYFLLQDLVDAPELFKAYPRLKDLQVIYSKDMSDDVAGTYIWQSNAIYLNYYYNVERRRIKKETELKKLESEYPALHELRRATDALFADYSTEDEFESARQNYLQIEEKLKGTSEFARYAELQKDKWIEVAAGHENLLHEVQHAIQHIEGFAQGGNESTYNNYLNSLKEKHDAWSMVKEFNEKRKELGEDASQLDVYKAVRDEYMSAGMFGDGLIPSREVFDKGFNLWVRGYDNEGYEDAYKEYQHLASKFGFGLDNNRYNQLSGEVEARNAQSRINLTPSERRERLLKETEDVSREDQIVLLQDFDQAMTAVNLDKMDSEDDSTDIPEAQYDDLDYDSDNLTEAQQLALDAVMAALDNAGVEVDVVSEEIARAEIEKGESDGNVRLMLQIMEQGTLGLSYHPIAGAKLQKNLQTTKENYKKLANSTKNAISDIAKALGAHNTGTSNYITIEAKNGKIFTLRISNHNATVSNFDNNGEQHGISIVISRHDNHGIINNGNAYVVEFFYPQIALTRAEGTPIADIIGALEQTLYSGEYTDPTGLAERQEVNIPATLLQTQDGTVYGYAKDGKIHLTHKGLNPNTPIHEYAHLWAKAMQRNNPQGWQSAVERLKGTPMWDAVVNDPHYQSLADENAIASEVLARYSGKRGAERMETMAKELLAQSETRGEAAKAVSLIQRAKKALQDFWKWVGTNLFGIKEFRSAEEIADRVLYDLLNGTDIRQAGIAQDGRAEFSIQPDETLGEYAHRVAQAHQQKKLEAAFKNKAWAVVLAPNDMQAAQQKADAIADYLTFTFGDEYPLQVLPTTDHLAEQLQTLGIEEEWAKKIEKTIQSTPLSNGFMLNGTIFVLSNRVDSPSKAKNVYIHERQHVDNEEYDLAEQLMEDISAEEAVDMLRMLKPAAYKTYSDMYLGKGVAGHRMLLDELIAYAVSESMRFAPNNPVQYLRARGITNQQLLNIVRDDSRRNRLGQPNPGTTSQDRRVRASGERGRGASSDMRPTYTPGRDTAQSLSDNLKGDESNDRRRNRLGQPNPGTTSQDRRVRASGERGRGASSDMRTSHIIGRDEDNRNQPPLNISDAPTPDADETRSDYVARFKMWYDQQRSSEAEQEYHKALKDARNKTEYAVQHVADRYRPLQKFQEFILSKGGTIRPSEQDADGNLIRTSADAYQDTTLATGRAGYQVQRFKSHQLQDMADAIAAILDSKKLDGTAIRWNNIDTDFTDEKKRKNGTRLTARELIGVYTQAKDCQEAIEQELPDRGTAGFLRNLQDAEGEPVSHEQVVSMVEDAVPADMLDRLWETIRAATQFSLDYQLAGGMIDQATHARYTRQYYVPERGWRERDLEGREDQYVEGKGTHLNGNPYNAALRKANGRESIASDPFAYIQSIAETTILTTERNKVKQKFLQMLLDNQAIGMQTGAWEIRRAYVVRTTDSNGQAHEVVTYEKPEDEKTIVTTVVPESMIAISSTASRLRSTYIASRNAQLRSELFAEAYLAVHAFGVSLCLAQLPQSVYRLSVKQAEIAYVLENVKPCGMVEHAIE